MSPVHLHLLLNHVPVIGTVIALCLLAYAWMRRDESIGRAALALLVVLAVAAAATFFTGEPAEEALEGASGISEALIERHEEAALLALLAIAALGVASLAVLLVSRGRTLARGAMLTILVAGLVPMAALAYTANLGGQIRHPEIRGGASPAPAAGQAAAEPSRAGHGDDD